VTKKLLFIIHLKETLNALVGAAFGAGGQRCMALSVVVFVGESKNWIPDIAKKAQSLTLGHGKENVDISPLCYSDVYYNY
jgi:malonate-semialdehyde dehydrogenase (acetylating)/methylmalonate-semialdehyde dehydrogenase